MKERDLEMELSRKFQKALEEHPEKFPKLGPTCFTGRTKGFRLIEAENEEQLMNLVTYWAETETWKLTPYFEARAGEGYARTTQKWLEWREKQ